MTTPIGAVGTEPVPTATPGSTGDTLGGIGSDGFMQLLIAQLQYQNPLEPSDPTDMMLQTSQLAQLDATQQLLSLHQRQIGMHQAVAAAGMVGDTVSGTTPEGVVVDGVVDAVRFTTAGPVLDVAGTEIAFGDVTEVRAGPAEPDTDTTTETETTTETDA